MVKIDNSLVFFADYQGTENFQIYKISDAFHAWPEPITQNPKVRYEWGEECFSNDGKNITYSSNESNPSNMLVYVHNIDSNQTSCVTADKPGWYIPGYWSPDNNLAQDMVKVLRRRYIMIGAVMNLRT